ncbi:hypothetical protein D5085_10105 [Ectothiorhodospiraceae bacterium BW-2]|nr:hypothetical protein D5085_10105 [Ectothiorhodospiraceae bacterium BW-2]
MEDGGCFGFRRGGFETYTPLITGHRSVIDTIFIPAQQRIALNLGDKINLVDVKLTVLAPSLPR